jgi:hypothetical protein
MFTPRVDATHASARAGARLLNTTNRQTEKWQQQCRQNLLQIRPQLGPDFETGRQNFGGLLLS